MLKLEHIVCAPRQEPAQERAAWKAAHQAGNVGQAPERCEHCDDTGDVTSIDGEWRGYCTCDAGKALKSGATSRA